MKYYLINNTVYLESRNKPEGDDVKELTKAEYIAALKKADAGK